MMDRLGILHLTTFLQGGAGRAIVDLACAQHTAGHRVTVVTSKSSKDEFGNYPDYLLRLRLAGITLHTLDSLFVRDVAVNMRVVDMLIRSVDLDGVDIIHAHAAVPASIGEMFAAAARSRIAATQTQHGWGINKTPQQAAFDLEILGRMDRVITTSKATADLLVGGGVARGSITVIPCGLAAAEPGNPPPAAAGLQARRAPGVCILGCIGSVTPNKNQRLILEALRNLSDPTILAAFVGEGSEALVAEARALGVDDQVVACGYQPDASRWLPLFDVLVVPSRTEGQGMVVLEAFRAGVPVIASDIPALAELVDNESSGFVFESGKAAALADAVQRARSLSVADRHVLVRAARKRFETDFTIDRMVARHEELYRELAAERSLSIA